MGSLTVHIGGTKVALNLQISQIKMKVPYKNTHCHNVIKPYIGVHCHVPFEFSKIKKGGGGVTSHTINIGGAKVTNNVLDVTVTFLNTLCLQRNIATRCRKRVEIVVYLYL